VRILRLIAERREPAVFEALKQFLDRGHRLTLLLGNHDLELSLPAVRETLRELLGASEGRFQFLYDNEAYVAGEAVIEHGNRADAMNEVDHDGLRRVRVLQSRHSDSEADAPFTPPVGSRLVAELMNPLKIRFPFIDLLKPEAEGMVPILIALEPKALLSLPRILDFGARGLSRSAVDRLLPRYGDEIASSKEASQPGPPRAHSVNELLRITLGEQDASELLGLIEPRDEFGGEIAATSAIGWRPASALWLLRRLVSEDRTFDTTVEKGKRYREVAAEHIANGFRVVVFGHTHRACRETIAASEVAAGTYLNSGSWVDFVQVPTALLHGERAAAQAAMEEFLRDLSGDRLERWVVRRPTYIRLEIDADGGVPRSDLCLYRDPDPDSPANILHG
jgi:UDP-2,3-diacylglucosamine pyrophosphatase LpxH